MTSTINHAALITAALGTIVASQAADGQETRFKIASLADKTGKLKSGEKGQYVVLQSEADTAIVVNLHPQAAQRLLTEGEADGYKVIERVGEQPAAEPTTEAAPAKKAKAPKAPKVKAEKPAKAPKVKAEKPAKEPKAPSKKALTIALYDSMKAEGKTRAEIIAAMMAQLGLSQAGANTYYQNVKSGAWVATPAAATPTTAETGEPATA